MPTLWTGGRITDTGGLPDLLYYLKCESRPLQLPTNLARKFSSSQIFHCRADRDRRRRPVCGEFADSARYSKFATHSFDTADLKEAKALLEELNT